MPLSDCYAVDTEQVSQTILNLQCGKAPDITRLTTMHLIHSHPSASIVLPRLFQQLRREMMLGMIEKMTEEMIGNVLFVERKDIWLGIVFMAFECRLRWDKFLVLYWLVLNTVTLFRFQKLKTVILRQFFYDDFRGIAISPVISKVFEYCLIDRFQDFLKTGDSLGSKRRLAAAMQFLVFVR